MRRQRRTIQEGLFEPESPTLATTEGAPSVVESRWRLLPGCGISRVCSKGGEATGAFPISRSRAHTHRRHGHPLQTVPSAGLIERPQEKNRVDALR